MRDNSPGLYGTGESALAIDVLARYYQDAIVSYCGCHLLDQEGAREVAREIFLAAFESIPGFCGHCDPPGQPVACLGCPDTPNPPQAATPWHRNDRVVWSGAWDESRRWVARTGPVAPTTPTVLVSRTASPLPRDPGGLTEAAMHFDHYGWFGRAETQEATAL